MKKLTYALLLAVSAAHAQNDGIAIKVDDSAILKSEITQTKPQILAQYRTQGVHLSNSELDKITKDYLIHQKLQENIIARAGITPNEDVITQQMLEIARAEGFENLNDFISAIEMQNAGSALRLRQNIIDEAAMQALWQQSMQERIHITDAQIDAFIDQNKTQIHPIKYRSLHVRLPFVDNTQKSKDLATSSAQKLNAMLTGKQDIQNALDTIAKEYPVDIQVYDTGYIFAPYLPASVADIITNLSPNNTHVASGDNGVDIIYLIDAVKDAPIVQPQWQTSHILVKNTPLQNNAQYKIETLYTSLQQGADFETLAATYSDDSASAQNQGSLGWVSEGDMVPEFEQMMKNTKKGDYSTPFMTPFGWHILKVNDVRQVDTTEQYYKNVAEQVLFEQALPTAQQEWLNELTSHAYIEYVQ